MPSLKKTKFNGVYYRDSEKSTKLSATRKPDRCFYIRFYHNKKCVNKKVGWVSEGYTAQTVANMKADLIKKWVSNNDPNKPKVSTFNDLFEIFMLWAKQNKKSWRKDNGIYHYHIKSFLGDKKIEEITPADINNMLLIIKSRGKNNGEPFAPQTLKHIFIVVKRIFNFNIDLGNCEINPANKIKLEKFDNSRMVYLLDDEIERIFEYLDSGKELDIDIAFIKFAFFTGLRKGELFNLTWDNVDLENKRIFLYETKGGKNQSVMLPDNAVKILQSLERIDTYVFPSTRGGKRSSADRLWKRVKKNANIRPDIRFHDIRHTFGTIAVSSGIGIDVVQRMMTHKSIRTTQRYAHIVDQRLQQAADTMNSAFDVFNKKDDKEKS